MKIRLACLTALTTISSLILAGGAVNSAPKPQMLPHFSSIEAAGHLHITLIGDAKLEGLNIQNLSKKSTTQAYVQVSVKNNVLYLQNLAKVETTGSIFNRHKVISKPADINVTIRIPDLNSLTVGNHTTVNGKNIHSKGGLTLTQVGDSQVTLDGNILVNRIIATGNSTTRIAWVDSKVLRIDANKDAHIQLAGIAKSSLIKLANQAYLDGRFLRSQTVWVQNRDNAVAKLQPVSSLRAFAYNNASVYYYNAPKHLSRSTTGSANVLAVAPVDGFKTQV